MNVTKLRKKYGLHTAIAMIVGVVAGSGIFFKAEAVLSATGGDVRTGVAAWVAVGLVMIICSNAFAVLAARYERANSLVDFAEAETGPTFSFLLGWFMASIYYPSLNAILAWISARYLCILFGVTELTGGMSMLLSAFFLVLLFVFNSLAPVIAGYFQVTTTAIKILPLVCMAVFGTLAGSSSGMLARNFYTSIPSFGSGGFFAAIIAVAFAYEGWITGVSINGELRNAKRNMPIALTVSSLIIVAVYVFFYIGLTGTVTVESLMESGSAAVFTAFETLFGEGIGTAVFVLMVISCVAACNGLTLANCRGFYALAARRHIPARFAVLDPGSNMPLTSAFLSLLLSMVWLLHFYGSSIAEPWFPALFCFDSSELPIITLYGLYIPIFLMMMKREKEMRPFQRFVLPLLAIICCLCMVAACVFVHRVQAIGYLLVFAVDSAIGLLIHKRQKKLNNARKARTP